MEHFLFPSIKKEHLDLLFLYPYYIHLLGFGPVFHSVKIILKLDIASYCLHHLSWLYIICLLSFHQVLDKTCNLGLLYQLSV